MSIIGTPAPFCKFHAPDNNGEPAASYQLFVYAAGTTTKVTTYTNSALSAANTNPIILDSSGRASIYLVPGTTYKFVLASPTDTDPPTVPIWTEDNIQAVPGGGGIDLEGTAGEAIAAGKAVYLSDGGGARTAGRWYKTSAATAYSSSDAPMLGFALTEATGAASTFLVRLSGKLTTAGLVAGTTYYLDDATPGDLVLGSLAPDIYVPVGAAESATSLIFPVPKEPSQTIRPALATFGYTTGQGNNAGGADTLLNSYSVLLPANYLDQPGSHLVIEGSWTAANNGNAKTVKFKCGGGTLVTCWSSSASVANHLVRFRWQLIRRTDSTGILSGIVWHGVAAGGAPSNYLTYVDLGAVNFTTDQTLAIYAAGNGGSDIVLVDYSVAPVRSLVGTQV